MKTATGPVGDRRFNESQLPIAGIAKALQAGQIEDWGLTAKPQ